METAVLSPVRLERRGHPRCELNAQITLYDPGSGRSFAPNSDILDISRGGMRLQLPQPLPVGQVFRFRIERYGLDPIAGKARVLWSLPWAMGHQCGARIQSMNWFHARRLELCLNPQKFDVLKILDWSLLLGIAVMGYFALSLKFQLPGNPIDGLWDLLNR